MNLIGLTGAIGSGKTTVASLLCQNHGYIELTFKGAMVACLAHIFNCGKDIFYDRELKELPNSLLFGKSPREVMQTFGTDWGRKQIHGDIWIKRVELAIAMSREFEPDRRLVVSDVRFENEAEMIKRLGGQIWRIERKDNPFNVETSHESEQGLDPKYVDAVINNNICLLFNLELSVRTALQSSESTLELVKDYYGA